MYILYVHNIILCSGYKWNNNTTVKNNGYFNLQLVYMSFKTILIISF